jgi:hypothetical protein
VFGFNAALWRYLDDQLTVAVLCNEGDSPAEEMAKGIAGIVLGLPSQDWSKASPVKDTEPGMTDLLKAVLAGAAAGRVDESLFTESARRELVQTIRRAGPDFLANKGAIRTIDLLDDRTEAAGRRRLYRVTFEHATLLWTLVLDPVGKIVSLDPKEE